MPGVQNHPIQSPPGVVYWPVPEDKRHLEVCFVKMNKNGQNEFRNVITILLDIIKNVIE